MATLYAPVISSRDKYFSIRIHSHVRFISVCDPRVMMSKVSKNILKLTKEEKRQFIDSFDLVLNDCDGSVNICILIWIFQYIQFRDSCLF